MKKLSGWQRLWIMFSIILIFPFIFFAIILRAVPTNIENPNLIAEQNKDKIIKVEIEKLGVIEFPDNLKEKEIENIIKKYFDKSQKEQIPIIAKNLINKRNEDKANESRKINEMIKSDNRKIIWYSIIGWLLTIVLIYALGFSIGWVYKGFKKVG